MFSNSWIHIDFGISEISSISSIVNTPFSSRFVNIACTFVSPKPLIDLSVVKFAVLMFIGLSDMIIAEYLNVLENTVNIDFGLQNKCKSVLV